ncbi:hypothetical protein C5167_023827 [Papaver somniferum]|uniref:Uncharacterized protein n=1 Tax=Papaver somniferum TaxID=3469 RepID=A0A4Y7JQQ1_PAPSO|nr:hypothetical protein C5167_023827 [Papaver somniferum]
MQMEEAIESVELDAGQSKDMENHIQVYHSDLLGAHFIQLGSSVHLFAGFSCSWSVRLVSSEYNLKMVRLQYACVEFFWGL